MSDVHITDNSEAFKTEMEKKIRAALKSVGIHLEGEAKEELESDPRRIDTGLLRNSVTYALDGESPAISRYTSDDGTEQGEYSGFMPSEKKGGAVYIGTNVEYGIYVHEGTVRMAPNRFLKNAVSNNQEQVKQFVEEELKSR